MKYSIVKDPDEFLNLVTEIGLLSCSRSNKADPLRVHPDDQQHKVVHEFDAETYLQAASYYQGYVTRWEEAEETTR